MIYHKAIRPPSDNPRCPVYCLCKKKKKTLIKASYCIRFTIECELQCTIQCKRQKPKCLSLTCASPRPSSMASRLLRSSPDFSCATGGWVQSSREFRSWACSPRSVSRPCMTVLVLRTISSWLSRSRASSRGYTMVDIARFHTHCEKREGKPTFTYISDSHSALLETLKTLGVQCNHILPQKVAKKQKRAMINLRREDIMTQKMRQIVE